MSNNVNNKRQYTKRIAICGVMLALSLILSYMEKLIPISFSLPGIKIGLANLVSIMLIYLLGSKEAYIVSIVRVMISNFLFGSIAMIPYGLCGAIISIFVMSMLMKTEKFSMISISACGGVVHNLSQLLVAVILMGTSLVFATAPMLMLSGAIFGLMIGILGGFLAKRLKFIKGMINEN